MAVKQLRKAFLAMTPQLIPVCETYEALVAGARKTAVMRACMVFKTYSSFKNSRSDRTRLGALPCMNTSLAQGFSCAQIIFRTSHTWALSSDEHCSYENVDHQTW